MKKLIKKSVATALGVIVLSQGIYANGLPTTGNMDLIAKTDKPVLATETIEKAILAKEEVEKAILAKGDMSNIIQLDDVVKKVAKEMKLAAGYKVEDTNLSTDDMYLKKVWHIYFTVGEDSINVQADAETGEILAFETWQGNNKRVFTYTREDVKKTVTDYINAHYGDIKNDIVEIDEKDHDKLTTIYRNSNGHKFIFARKIGGELFLNNYITISVSGVTGKIVSLQKKWDDVSYNKKTNILAAEEAMKYFKDLKAIKIKYINVYDDDKKTLKPVYYFDETKDGLLDAHNKKFYTEEDIYAYNNRGNIKYTNDTATEEMADKDAGGMGQETIPEEGVVSKEAAEKIIMEHIAAITDTKNSRVAYSHYRTYHNGEEGKFWSFNIESEDPQFFASAVMDAETKDVLQVRYRVNDMIIYPMKDGETPKEALVGKDTSDIKVVEDKAKALMLKMFPSLKNEKLTIEATTEDDRTIITGTRSINNIPYYENGFNMEYDAETDTFTSIYYNWGYNLSIEQPKKMISAEEATNIFYKEVGVDKHLIQLKDKEKEQKENVIVPEKELVLAYGINPYPFNYIDAATGKKLHYSGEVFEGRFDEVRVFEDIDGHTYEKAIKLMNKMGFVKADSDNFAPAGVLKKKDAIKWIVLTLKRQYGYIPSASRNYKSIEMLTFKDINEDDPYYEYIQEAVVMGIIEDANYFNKDKGVTMVQLLKWIINGMGQKELAESDIFKEIEGITSKDNGYVGLARYYNIVDEKSDLTEALTRGKILQTLYDFIYELEN